MERKVESRRGIYNSATIGYTPRGAGKRGVWSIDVDLKDAVVIVGTGRTIEKAGLEAEFEVEKWLAEHDDM